MQRTRLLLSLLALYGSVLAISPLAQAQTTRAQADDRPLVLFFGGHGSSVENMLDWEQAAKAKCGKQFVFEGIPYPSGASPDRNSVERFGGAAVGNAVAMIDKLMRQIPKRKFIIVGHSSGSALADDVAAKISDPGRAKLITLDGFHPSESLQERIQTACWSSEQEGGLRSPNYATSKSACGKNFHVFKTQGCRSKMCMHFRLVNQSADPDLAGGGSSRNSSHGYVVKGYSHISANLDWLQSSCASSEHDQDDSFGRIDFHRALVR